MDTAKYGFKLISSSELKEINGRADIYKHEKSGFTLVEIVVAFAVFAIMAAMIAQIISLANTRQNIPIIRG